MGSHGSQRPHGPDGAWDAGRRIPRARLLVMAWASLSRASVTRACRGPSVPSAALSSAAHLWFASARRFRRRGVRVVGLPAAHAARGRPGPRRQCTASSLAFVQQERGGAPPSTYPRAAAHTPSAPSAAARRRPPPPPPPPRPTPRRPPRWPRRPTPPRRGARRCPPPPASALGGRRTAAPDRARPGEIGRDQPRRPVETARDRARSGELRRAQARSGDQARSKRGRAPRARSRGGAARRSAPARR